MDNFAFISRHTPTEDQIRLAAEQDINLVHIGDFDAFNVYADEVISAMRDAGYEVTHGVVVVHPAAAMRLAQYFDIAVFENGNRAAVGEKPEFFAKAFHVYE
jgi:hypothetical protein